MAPLASISLPTPFPSVSFITEIMQCAISVSIRVLVKGWHTFIPEVLGFAIDDHICSKLLGHLQPSINYISCYALRDATEGICVNASEKELLHLCGSHCFGNPNSQETHRTAAYIHRKRLGGKIGTDYTIVPKFWKFSTLKYFHIIPNIQNIWMYFNFIRSDNRMPENKSTLKY